MKFFVDSKLAPGRKRIQAPVDSSSDEGQSPKKANPSEPLTVKEKEDRLIAIRAAAPDYETMVNSVIVVFFFFDFTRI